MNNMDREENGRGRRHFGRFLWFVGMVFARLLFIVVFALVLAIFVVWLWDWLMPALFGLGPITYLQAVGLMILARLVLGTFGHGFRGHGWHHRRPWPERFRHHGHPCGGGEHGDFDRTMKWWHNYKEFWRDEGKAAFEAYQKRTGKEGSGEKAGKK